MDTGITNPDEWIYDKINKFKYLDVNINTKNDWSQEIGIRIVKASLELSKFFKSKILSKKQKLNSTQW